MATENFTTKPSTLIKLDQFVTFAAILRALLSARCWIDRGNRVFSRKPRAS
ncbi:hypothetical protein CLIM01_02977 [Colletotrichum limetticola]|uniref:Uncharacterized protein n=1 Tax=Colletotrichum limetticola TaxID=1209924 RepID=A0ABQ9Q756_9PEZI|nr:hypothetical protein CLIM01_02977 [Colletotrichum limetticola]